MALCSLSTGRIGTPLRRAASITRPPAITSTSLLASAMVLPASIAASTASSPAVPDEAHSTTSTSGCVATATSPSAPAPCTGGNVPPSGGAQRVEGRGRWPSTPPTGGDAGHGRRHRRGAGRRGEADDAHAVGMGVGNGQRAGADRAGGAEDRDARRAPAHSALSAK